MDAELVKESTKADESFFLKKINETLSDGKLVAYIVLLKRLWS